MGQRTNLLLQVEDRSGARLNRLNHLQWGYLVLPPTPENHFPVLDADEARMANRGELLFEVGM